MKVKYLLVDCDGTMTDGNYYVSETGDLMKSFHTRDFHGLRLLYGSSVKVGFITMASDNVIIKQVQRCASYAEVFLGAHNKVSTAEQNVIQQTDIKWEDIAFIGDDIMDIPLLEKVGLKGCPCDAHMSVFAYLENLEDAFISINPGGRGAVRDFVDYILQLNKGSGNG